MTPTLQAILMQSLFQLEADVYVGDAMIFEFVHALIHMCTGQLCETSALNRKRWNVRPRYDTDITHNRSPYIPAAHTPIQRQDVLSADAWVELRPIEWGITTPSPQIAIGNTVDTTRGGIRGMYPHLSTTCYDKMATTDHPGDIINYGPASMNCATQGWLDRVRWPRVKYQQYRWANGVTPNYVWPEIQPVSAVHDNYMDLAIYKPCTILSYNYLEDCVLGPVLITDDDNKADFHQLRRSTLSQQPTIGLFKGGRTPAPTYSTLPSNKTAHFFAKIDE